MNNTEMRLEELDKDLDAFIEKQREILRNSESAYEREVAQDLIDILTGKETPESLASKEHRDLESRWNNYLIKYQLSADENILCKKCGYKRYSYKEYARDKYYCPGCRKEYAIVNDDDLYILNTVEKGELIWPTAFGVCTLLYVFYALFEPSVYIPMGGKTAKLFEFTGLARIPAFASMLCVIIALLSYIADHFDHRNNEHIYPAIRMYSGIGFFAFSTIGAFIQFSSSPH